MRVLCFDIGGTNVKYGVIDNEKFLEKGYLIQMQILEKNI